MDKNRWEEDLSMIEQALHHFLPDSNLPQKELYDAMRYSLFCGGKRIRPVLTLEFCNLCGKDRQTALPFACALEMIHTYSLIHDDLPCMDNAEMRRGKKANHKVFGEASAVLAGDALLTYAFEVALSEEAVQKVGADCATKAVRILAQAAGPAGMAGGQVLDLAAEGKRVSLDYLKRMDACKTGALILAAARMGCIVGGANTSLRKAGEEYARAIGLAFQIEDDILDVESSSEVLGKNAGSDRINEKSTYVSLLGLKSAKEMVENLTKQAVAALEPFQGADNLIELAKELAERSL